MSNINQAFIPGYDVGRMGVTPKGQQVIYREDLHYQDVSSDKIYIGIVSQTGATFYADCFYGRRGATASYSPQGEHKTEAAARSAMNKQLGSKAKKGYKPMGSATANAAPVANSDRYQERNVWPMGGLALNEKKRLLVIDNPEWVAEEKEDGVRITVHITPDGLRFFTRGASVNDPHKARELTKALFPSHGLKKFFPDEMVGTILDTEAMIPGLDSSQISGMLNATDGRALGDVYFKVFDLIQDGITDMTSLEWKLRRTKLTAIFNKMSQVFASIPSPPMLYRDGTHKRVSVISENYFDEGIFRLSRYTIKEKEAFHNEIIARGGEGTMWKNINSKYHEGGKPANNWYKWKKEETADVVIVGWTEGEGKYVGQIGAVIYAQWLTTEEMTSLGMDLKKIKPHGTAVIDGVDRWLVPIGKCSGMTDAIRQDITKNWENYSFKVMKVEFMERTKAGALRHPRFVQLHEDKHPSAAIYNPGELSGVIEVDA
ncbi:ATP-dependent DNA ligase [compost metagenome]